MTSLTALKRRCRRIAWSKTGCIATIDEDGHGVFTRQLFCNKGDGKWTLSQPISIKGISTLHCDYPIIHLSWNHQGHELAVFDSMGRVSIFTLLFTLSDFSAPRKCAIDTDDPLGVVVGLIWLNNEKPVIRRSLMGAPILTRQSAHLSGICI